MTSQEITTFIETMEEIGDIWTPEQVKDAYGVSTLNDAIFDRKSHIEKLTGIIGKVIDR